MPKELEEMESLVVWRQSLEDLWEEPLEAWDWENRLGVLGGFSEFVGESADEMIANCMDRSGDHPRTKVPSIKKYWALIHEYAAGKEPEQASILMSFFIHNGVLMQAPGV